MNIKRTAITFTVMAAFLRVFVMLIAQPTLGSNRPGCSGGGSCWRCLITDACRATCAA